MAKMNLFGVLAVMTMGGVLGYGVASVGRNTVDKPTAIFVLSEPKPMVAMQPEFVIDDCCTFPGMTQGEFRSALHNER